MQTFGTCRQTFPPLSSPALFQGFSILTLICTLGSWGYPLVVDFWAKISPLVFACVISRLLDSHPHIYLGLMGLSPRCRLLGLVGKNFPLVFACLISRLFGFSPSYLPGLMGLSPRCRLLGLVGKICPPFVFACLISRLLDSHPHIYLGSWGYPPVVDFWDLLEKMCVFLFLCCKFYPNSSTSCRPLFWPLIPGKPMASGVTYQVFVILARFSTACHGQPSFWASHPYLRWA